jgi:cell division protease FtsH
MPNCEPVLKVTIIPRGMAGGYTWSLGSDDTLISRARFLDMIAMALGGRVAEELVFDDVTTGASGDLRQVTRYARSMVTAYGMSDRLGPMAYGEKQEMVFLGREIGEQRDYSEAVAQEIDSEVRSIVSSGYEKARETLTTHYEALERVAETLMEVETLEREEFEAIVRGEEVDFSRKKAAKQQRSARSQPTAEKGRRGEDQGGTELPPAAPSPA